MRVSNPKEFRNQSANGEKQLHRKIKAIQALDACITLAGPPVGIKPELQDKSKPKQQIVASGRWAVSSDGIQWILERQKGGRWIPVSFVRSTKAVLARSMREKGAAADELAILGSLPEHFLDSPQTDLEACSARSARPKETSTPRPEKTAPARDGGTA